MKRYFTRLLLEQLLLVLLITNYTNQAHAQWTQVCPEGKIVTCMTTIGSIVYAGTYGDGIYQSTDYGSTWTQVNNELGMVLSLTVSGTTLFAGSYWGVFRSTDSWSKWTNVSIGLTDNRVLSLTVSGTTLFAGTYSGGVFRSTNNGASWTAVNVGLYVLNVQALIANGTILLAGTDKGMFRSTNNGSTWSQACNGDIRSFLVRDTTLFAGDYGVLRSVDNGMTWTRMNSGMPQSWVRAFAVIGTTLFAGTYIGGVFRSTDNGINWTAVNSGLTNPNIFSLTVCGKWLFAGTDGGGVFRMPLNTSSVEFTDPDNAANRCAKLALMTPNPGTNNIEVHYTIQERTDATLIVTDVQGRTVAELPQGIQEMGEYNTALNIGNVADGVYMVALRTHCETITQKLVVVR